ncbi:GntR family transcriptional regulator [Cohnella thailandensis]|uniref:GntR family transcriptional regulator n=1 Tax=Cohnella thailandensis TaxID=557557 RepID=A0A841T1A2_9BACL|nr:GntR family transcriptional regulator [Cohnella thailandensis]MBB6637322.1 GntR family transcriptional regulator [Cohnella thailandensis]MBP1976650.1 DNA-binding GntR family transcriptional regulator [Cohnella thailandensis]
MSSISKIEHEDLDQLTYKTLKKMILDGQLKQGEKIVQDTLANLLGVSRTPLRRAISQLIQERLIENNGRGTFVKQHTQEEIIAAFEIRAVLEGLASRLCVRYMTDADIRGLEELFKKAMAEITDEDWSAYREADREFHNRISKHAKSEMLSGILDQFQVLGITYLKGLTRPPQETIVDHLNIIQALKNRSEDEAERAAIAHIRKSIEAMKSIAN